MTAGGRTCRWVVAALGVALCAGCGGIEKPYEPVVDMNNVDPARYQADLAACRAFAKDESSGVSVGIGGLFGVGSGAIGAGTSVGGGPSDAQMRTSIRQCLTARGYRVMS